MQSIQPMEAFAKVEFELQLQVFGWVLDLEYPKYSHNLKYLGLTHGISKESKVYVSMFVRLAKPSQVFFGGDSRGESGIKSEDEIGALVEYEFRVSYHLL